MNRSFIVMIAAVSVFCLYLHSSFAADFSIRTELDKPEALLGDEISFKVVVIQPDGEEYSLSEKPDFGKLRLLKRSESSTKKDHDKTEKTFTFILAGYELGDFSIPPLSVFSSSGDTGFKTEEIKVKIKGQIGEEEKGDLKDVASPVPFYERTWLPLYILAGTACAVGLFFLVRRYLKRRKRGKSSTGTQDSDLMDKTQPPHEVALKKLNALLADDLLKKGEYKRFHFILSEIIREYIGRRLAFDSMELTTVELIEKLRGVYTVGLDLGEFENFCERTDLVKFAKHLPVNSEVSGTVDLAFSIIRSTTPVHDGGNAEKREKEMH